MGSALLLENPLPHIYGQIKSVLHFVLLYIQNFVHSIFYHFLHGKVIKHRKDCKSALWAEKGFIQSPLLLYKLSALSAFSALSALSALFALSALYALYALSALSALYELSAVSALSCNVW